MNPDYLNIGDHSESVRILYNSSMISYSELTTFFFSAHNPFKTRLRRQYASLILPHNNAQQEIAIQTKEIFETAKKCKSTTEIYQVPSGSFTIAEDYHQKYLLQQSQSLMDACSQILDRNRNMEQDFLLSSFATKLNGYFVDSTILNSPDELRYLGLSTQDMELIDGALRCL